MQRIGQTQQEVRYAIMGQVARGFWGKITWRRKSTMESGKEEEEKEEEADSR